MLFRSQWYQWSPVLTVNVHEMQRVRKLLAKSPRAAKLSLGKWTWSAENPLRSWDTIQKAPLWQDEEWADLRIALARPVKETAVTTTDGEKSTTIWLNKPQYGTEATGARAEAIAFGSWQGHPVYDCIEGVQSGMQPLGIGMGSISHCWSL